MCIIHDLIRFSADVKKATTKYANGGSASMKKDVCFCVAKTYWVRKMVC